MELGSHDIGAANDGRDRPAVIDMRQKIGGISHAHGVGMDEIGVIADLYPRKHRMGLVDHQIVPTHMRHLQRRVGGRDARHLTLHPVEPRHIRVFTAPCGQHLHADANAQERHAALLHARADRLFQPIDRL